MHYEDMTYGDYYSRFDKATEHYKTIHFLSHSIFLQKEKKSVMHLFSELQAAHKFSEENTMANRQRIVS